MAQQIGMAVKIGADLSGLKGGVGLARNEIRQLGSIMRQAETPAEKLEKKTELLERAMRSGELGTEDYQKALTHLKSRYGQVQQGSEGLRSSITSQVPAIQNLQSRMSGLTPVTVGVGAAIAGVTAAVGLAVTAFKGMVGTISATIDKMGELDSTIKAARGMGADLQNLQRLTLDLGESTGLGSDEIEKSLAGLSRRIGEAAMGTGEARIAFQKLGLDVREMVALDPTEQFRRIGVAMQGVKDKSTQLAIANKLFEEQGRTMINGLLSQGDAFEDASHAADLYGLTINEIEGQQIELANDRLARMQAIWDGITTRLSAELAPTIIQIGLHIEAMLVPLGGVSGLVDRMVLAMNEFYALSVSTSHVLKSMALVQSGYLVQGAIALNDALEARGQIMGEAMKNRMRAEAQFQDFMDQREKERQETAEAMQKARMDAAAGEVGSSIIDMIPDAVSSIKNSASGLFGSLAGKVREAAAMGKDQLDRSKKMDSPAAIVAGSQEAYKFITDQNRNEEMKAMREREKQSGFLESIMTAVETMAENPVKIGVIS